MDFQGKAQSHPYYLILLHVKWIIYMYIQTHRQTQIQISYKCTLLLQCVESSSLIEESLKFALLNQGGDLFYPTNVSPIDEEPGYCDHLLQELPQLIPIFQVQRYISLLQHHTR